MFLSDFIKNNSLLQAVASPGAVNANDIIQLNAIAQAGRVVCSDYAAANAPGATPMAQQRYSVGSLLGSASNARCSYVDASGNIYVGDTNAAGKPTVWKFSPTGQVLASLVLTNTVINPGPGAEVTLAHLSNGDIAACWVEPGGAVPPTFAIVDSDLYAVKHGPTAIGSSGANPLAHLSMCALSGGGFFLTWTWAANGSYIAVYDNAGNVVKAATAIAGAPAQNSGTSLGMAMQPAQLTSGNVAVAMADTNAHVLAYAIFSPVGNVVVAYTSIVGGNGGATTAYPAISVMAGGYWAMTTGRQSNSTQQLAVFNDAGALQGVLFSGTAGNGRSLVTNDGTSFWLVTSNIGDTVITRVGITGGASAVQTAMGGLGLAAVEAQALKYDPDFGLLYVSGDTTAAAFVPQATGKVLAVGGIVGLGAIPVNAFIELVGDGCLAVGAGGYIEVAKIIATAVLGVAAQSVAAGNAGTPFLFNMGPGGFQTAAFRGHAGLAFDHSAANPLGNKGVFVTGRSLSLKGI